MRNRIRLDLFLSVLIGFLLALVLAGSLLWGLLGTQGVSLLVGWSAVRLAFVGEYSPEDSADEALDGMVRGLGDRWSYYASPQSYQALLEYRSNSYVGIGVVVSFEDPQGLLLLIVQEGGPAQKAGLEAGELILAVDGASVSQEGQEQVLDRIAGERGTSLVLTVQGKDGTTRDVTVVRDLVRSQTVHSQLLDSGVGYVALKNFNDGTAQEFNAAVDALVEAGATALVFDMRNNGGGYVAQLTKILDHLLPEGPIFRSRSKLGLENVVQSDKAAVDLPMAVLVNGDSYSAAEFFAAELREKAGAIIVGEPTCGKGYSQNTLSLPNGGALNFSTETYYTGQGVSLIGTGVTLDRELALSERDQALLLAGVLDPEEDPQLQAALELLDRA